MRNDPRKILFITPYLPCLDVHGGGTRLWETITRTSKSNEVHLLSYLTPLLTSKQRKSALVELHKQLATVRTVELNLQRPDRYPHYRPAELNRFITPEWKREIHKTLYQIDPDLVQVEFLSAAASFPEGFQERSFLTIHELRSKQLWEEKKYLEAIRMLFWERKISKKFKEVHLLSEQEITWWKKWGVDKPVRYIPTGVSLETFSLNTKERDPNELLFVGMFDHAPNLAAAKKLTHEIFPRVQKELPEARLTLIGNKAPSELSCPGINILGNVENIAQHYQLCGLFVAPLVSGGGVRMKILEALACGAPTLTTQRGLNGIQDNGACWQAETNDQFVNAIIEAIRKPGERLRRGKLGHQAMEKDHTWKESVQRLHQRWESVAPTQQLKIAAQPKISVIIPTKNPGPQIEELIEKIYAQEIDKEIEVILIDSGSTDGSIEKLTYWPIRHLQIHPQEFNHGSTRNIAAANARGDYLVFTVQDALPKNKNWLQTLVRPLQEDPNIMATTGNTLPPLYSNGITQALAQNLPNSIKQLDNVNSAMRKVAWEKQPFNSVEFGEDLLWSIEAKKKKWNITHIKEASMYHGHSYTSRTYARRVQLDTEIKAKTLHETPPTLKEFFHHLAYQLKQDCQFLLRLQKPWVIPKLISLRISGALARRKALLKLKSY